MDKYEYQAKLEEINKLVENEDYEEAAGLADTIEWKRVRSVRTLCMVSELYEAVGRVEDSKAILYRAYRRSPNSRQILYRLAEVCVQTQDFDDAVEYYTEYVNLSPNDTSKYILKYEIYKGRGSSVEEQIQVLEELKSKEYSEQWAYELAKLYDQAHMAEKCVAECDDLALWFHNGKYVVQALELKQKYMPLTPEQQTIYDNPSEIVDMATKEQVVEKAVPTLDQEIMKEMPTSEKDVIADSIIMNTEKEIAAAVAEHKDTVQEEKKPVRGFDAINLQSELANSMREILAGIRPAPSVDELENAPVLKPLENMQSPQSAAEPPVTEEEIPGQLNIDDILTQGIPAKEKPVSAEQKEPVAQERADAPQRQEEAIPEEDILSAPTIDISAKIRQEIGNKNLREYAAEQAAREREIYSAQTQERPQTEQPQIKMPEQPQVKAAEAEQPQMEQPRTEMSQRKEPEEPVKIELPRMEAAEAEQPQMEQSQIKMPAAEPEVRIVSEPKEEAAQMADREQTQQAPAPEAYSRDRLDEKEKSMMGFWSSIRGMNEQVNDAVTRIMRCVLADKTSSRGNVILVGDAGNGRTTLALSIAKIICRCKGQQTVKAAKIYAEDLNSKDIAATVNKIAGGVLIIEEAGDLSDDAIAQLSMAMDFKTDSLVVFLEDERRYLQDLLARNPQFSQKFDITINVPILTNDELVEFGKYYALEKECVLDESAVTALYDCIGAMQTVEQPAAILDVKEVVDKAVRSAEKFGLGKLFATISGKRYDEEDRIIIKAKNFKKMK